MKVLVETVVTQLIEVPENANEQDLRNFLADFQSFNDAFAGVGHVGNDGKVYRILNLVPESDTILEWDIKDEV